MPLPSFDMRGLLPPFLGADATTRDRSPYFVTVGELAAALGTSPERRNLIRNLIAYRKLLADEGYESGIQFVDGSFVENVETRAKRPPGDIDLFSLLRTPKKYLGSPPPSQWATLGKTFWMTEVADREKNKQRFALDTYALLFEELQPMVLIRGTIYWYGLFSHQRETLDWKGFAMLELDPAGDEIALANMGSE